jgi:membrane-bound lytic murein transglycosylase D
MNTFLKFLYLFIGLGFVFLIIEMLTFSSDKTTSDAEYQKAFYKNYKIFAIEIPKELDFAGEKVLTNRYDVRESIDRELLTNTYWQSQTMLLIKRANRWFPVVEPILKKNNVPEDFKYLALAESGFANNTVSPVGAAGVWQFMKETAIKYGLEVNDDIDERYNIEKSTEAACKYLKESYNTYKSWTMAAASYNMGVGAASKQITAQGTQNYYDLFLNNETSRYVYRILALKIIVSNPKNYGFYLRKKDLYPVIPVYTVKVDSSITNLPAFAKKYEINYKILKEFNLWIRKTSLNNSEKKSYTLTIPNKGAVLYDSLLSRIPDEPFFISDSIN